jgi:hypothetical protein
MGEAAEMMLDGTLDWNGEYNPRHYTPRYIERVNRMINYHQLNAQAKGTEVIDNFFAEQGHRFSSGTGYALKCRVIIQQFNQPFQDYLKRISKRKEL